MTVGSCGRARGCSRRCPTASTSTTTCSRSSGAGSSPGNGSRWPGPRTCPTRRLAADRGHRRALSVVRGADGVLRAFANTCRHRGAELCPADGPARGHAGRVLRCPYHHWTYGLDGRLRADATPRRDAGRHRALPGGARRHGPASCSSAFEPEDAPPIGGAGRRRRSSHSQLRLGRAAARRQRHLRGGRQLEGDRRELQRVLPLRARSTRSCATSCRRSGGGGADLAVGARHPPPGRGVDLHHDRDDAPARRCPDSTRTSGSVTRASSIYPNLLLSLSADHVAAFTLLPRVGRAHHRRVRFPVRGRELDCRRLRPVRRGRALGPREPAGLEDRRERAARDGLVRRQPRMVRADGGRVGRHPTVVPRRDGRGLRWMSATPGPRRRRWWTWISPSSDSAGSGAPPPTSPPGAVCGCVGLERFELGGHARGASHDHSRIIRRSYHTEHYVRLTAAGVCGVARRRGGERPAVHLDDRAASTCSRADAAIDRRPATRRHDRGRCSRSTCSTAAEVRRRWPVLMVDDDVTALYQADDRHRLARRSRPAPAGAGLGARRRPPRRRRGPRVASTARRRRRARRSQGDDRPIRARTVVLAADAWTNELLAPLDVAAPAHRAPGAGHATTTSPTPRPAPSAPFPVWIWMDEPSFYGFPVFGGPMGQAGPGLRRARGRRGTRQLLADPAILARTTAFGRRLFGGALGSPHAHHDLPLHAHARPRLRARPDAGPPQRSRRPRRGPRLQVRAVVRPHAGRRWPPASSPRETWRRSPWTGPALRRPAARPGQSALV